MNKRLPVVIVLLAIIALGYPIALLFGLPLAKRDREDLRKWEKAQISSEALQSLNFVTASGVNAPDGFQAIQLPFSSSSDSKILVKDGVPLGWEYDSKTGVAIVPDDAVDNLVEFAPPLERVSEVLFRLEPTSISPTTPPTLYLNNTLLKEGSTAAIEVPDGQRTTFTFPVANGIILLDNQLLEDNIDYEIQESNVVLKEAPSFRTNLRRITADYTLLDAEAGLIAFNTEPPSIPQALTSSVTLAEQIVGETNGQNTDFQFANSKVVENDKTRQLYINDKLLTDTSERPKERVNGETTVFNFESSVGLITLDDVLLEEGKDYSRNENSITFDAPPTRNAKLRQYKNFVLSDPLAGTVKMAVPPPIGSQLWTPNYSIYDKPSCGSTLMQCFYALPQHPVPFPHWIVQRIVPFMQKYPLLDERHVLRATAYTTLGTLASLILGGIIGIILAVLFVLLRPLERALLPWVIASQTVPIIALVPVLLLVLGNLGITIQTSLIPTALIGAYITFFPVVVGTVKGLRSIDPLQLDLMKSYAATPYQVFTKLRFPAAVPFFFTSLKLGTAAALVGALVAETESNNSKGLGFQILGQVQSGNVADVWILLLISAFLGIALVGFIGLLQRLIAPWER